MPIGRYPSGGGADAPATFSFGDTHPTSDQLAAFPTPPRTSDPTRIASHDGAFSARYSPLLTGLLT